MTAKQSSSLEEKLAVRAVRELTDGIFSREALVLIYFPQYNIETVRSLPTGDFNMLVKAAQQYRISQHRMNLMIAGSSSSKQSYQSLLREFDKALKSLK